MAVASWECPCPQIFVESPVKILMLCWRKGGFCAQWEWDGVNHPMATAPQDIPTSPSQLRSPPTAAVLCLSSGSMKLLQHMKQCEQMRLENWAYSVRSSGTLGSCVFPDFGKLAENRKLWNLCLREQERSFLSSSLQSITFEKGLFFVLLILRLLILDESIITSC